MPKKNISNFGGSLKAHLMIFLSGARASHSYIAEISKQIIIIGEKNFFLTFREPEIANIFALFLFINCAAVEKSSINNLVEVILNI